jgi:hypothetical protein
MAWSPAATTREEEEFTLNRTLDADTHGAALLLGGDVCIGSPLVEGTYVGAEDIGDEAPIRTTASKLITPDANSPNASTSTRNCNTSEPPSPTATCTAESGSSPPHVSKLPRRTQPLGRSTYTSTLGNTLPHTPALGRPARSTCTKAWSPTTTTRKEEEFTLNRTLDADTHGAALLLGGDVCLGCPLVEGMLLEEKTLCDGEVEKATEVEE